MNINTVILVYLLRICCVGGCVIKLYLTPYIIPGGRWYGFIFRMCVRQPRIKLMIQDSFYEAAELVP
jgi:hypothetical protein